MSKPVFKYLVPFYYVWLVGHVVFFLAYIFTHVHTGQVAPSWYGVGILFASQFMVIVLGLALTVLAIVDCALRQFAQDSQKVLWIILIFFFSVIAAGTYYYLYGRYPRSQASALVR